MNKKRNSRPAVQVSRRGVVQSAGALAAATALNTLFPSVLLAGNRPLDDVPRSDYGFATTCDDVVAGMNLKGTTVLITGCNSGLGYESMRSLAAAGAHVIGTARTWEKAEAACASVEGYTTPVVCELTDMSSVWACAETIRETGRPIDALMCNAGIMALPELEQIDVGGTLLEKQFVVNHLGHYLLTRRLLDQVLAADNGKVVMVSSLGYTLAPEGGIQFDNLSGDNGYQAFKNYGQTKLANILFSNELSSRYDGKLTANAIHPGLVATNLGRYMRGDKDGTSERPDKPLRKGQKTAAQGAATQVYVAADPRLDGCSGFYFEDCNPVALKGDYAEDAKLAKKLWSESEKLVKRWL